MRLNRLILAAIGIWGVSVMANSPVWASDCMRLCNPQFMQDASPSDIRVEIRRGANINGKDDNLNTPLHFASFWGNNGAMRALLAAGAKPKTRTESGQSLLHLADNAKIVQLAIQAGLNIHATARNEQTPIHVSSRWGQPETIEALLAAGANLNIADNAGRRPVDLAALNPSLAGTNMTKRLRNW